jgi:hypothetical protein
MEEEIKKGWIKIYETFDYMTAELTEARLKDECIEYQVLNKSDIGYTMEVGNALLGRVAVGLPIKFYVELKDAEKARKLVNEDRSSLLDDENLEFDSE